MVADVRQAGGLDAGEDARAGAGHVGWVGVRSSPRSLAARPLRWSARACRSDDPIEATGLRYDRRVDPQDSGVLTPDRPASAGLRVGLLGLGTVGSAVAARLLDDGWRTNATARGHVPPVLVAVAARERRLELPPHVRVTDDPAEVAGADDVDVVVELLGGTDAAATAIRQALAAGKSVVSANKELLAKQGRDLEAAARAAGAGLRFEAAVAGGVPVLGPLVWDLGANRMTALRGIVNGTTNHILSTMASDDRDYLDVLREAQARGYAEADPSSDVEGLDAAYKLTLLARLAFDGWLDVASLRRSIPVFGARAIARDHRRRAQPPGRGRAAGPGHQAGRPGRAHRRAAACAPASRPWP